jgi:hypothetical protein
MTAGLFAATVDLFRLECRRLAPIGVAALALSLCLVTYYGRALDLLHQSHVVFEAIGAACGAAGWLLGVYQLSGHRRPAEWICLIHRPVPPQFIGAAIVAAGALLLFVVIAVPGIFLLTAQSWLGEHVVDSRHWLLPFAGASIAFAFYLAGCYAALVRRRYAPLLLVLPGLFALSEATGAMALLLQSAVSLWLLTLVLCAFEADPDRPPRSASALLALALPVQMGLYLLLLFGAGSVYQAIWIVIGSHPLNSVPKEGGFVEASRLPGSALIAAGIPEPMRATLNGRPVVTITPQIGRLPVRGEMVDSGRIWFDDERRGLRWTFSHDLWTFRGLRQAGGRSAAVYPTVGFAAVFERPPLQLGGGLMTDGSRLLLFDAESGSIRVRHALPTGETLAAAPSPLEGADLMLTDRALHVRSESGGIRVPLPAEIGTLERVDVARLRSDYLISFTFGRGWAEGRGSAFQSTFRVTQEGRAVQLGSRPLGSDYGEFFRQRSWWLSPVLSSVLDRAPWFLARRPEVTEAPRSNVTSGAAVLALLLTMAAAATAGWWTGQATLPAGRRFFWVTTALVFGLPGALAAMLAHPRSDWPLRRDGDRV